MSFIKRCVSTIIKCGCGKPSVINYRGKWYCVDCLNNLKKSKKTLKKTL